MAAVDVPRDGGNISTERTSEIQVAVQSARDQDNLLHVSNLTRNVKASHLHEIFGHYGEIKSVDLEIDKNVGLSKGFAHVRFQSAEDADEAMLHLDGGQIDGQTIKVSLVLVQPVASKKLRHDSPPRVAAGGSAKIERRGPERRGRSRSPSPRGRGRDSRDPRGRVASPPRRRRTPSPPRRYLFITTIQSCL